MKKSNSKKAQNFAKLLCFKANHHEIAKQFGQIGRAHCIANKLLPKRMINKMTDQECASLMMQHTRYFFGMDRPNVFTRQ